MRSSVAHARSSDNDLVSSVKRCRGALGARQARLKAEQDGRERVTFSQELSSRATDPSVVDLLSGEMRLFELCRRARLGQKAQLRERIDQLREQIQGLTVVAKKHQIDLISQELQGVRELWQKNLVQSLCRHLSVSVDAPGKMPKIPAVQAICQEFGVEFMPARGIRAGS